MKPQISRRKEIIKDRVENNGTERKKRVDEKQESQKLIICDQWNWWASGQTDQNKGKKIQITSISSGTGGVIFLQILKRIIR